MKTTAAVLEQLSKPIKIQGVMILVEPNAVADLVMRVSEYTRGYILPLDSLSYPAALDKYLIATVNPALTEFSADLKHLYETARSDGLERTPFYEQAYF